MSDQEELWIDPGHDDVRRAAVDLGEAMGFRVVNRGDEWYVVTSRLSDDLPVALHGQIEPNIDARFAPTRWPDDYSIFHRMPLVWTVESYDVTAHDMLDRCARALFDRISAVLPWSVVLTHRITELVADFDPERGVREFPPGTPADGTGRDVWG